MPSYIRAHARAEVVSFDRTGCMVARSEIQPSMTRPPCCGLSVAAAAGVADGATLAVGPSDAQAVATITIAARFAMNAIPLCFGVMDRISPSEDEMCPPLVLLLYAQDSVAVYPATDSAAARVHYAQ